MPDGVLAPRVKAPCARYEFRGVVIWPRDLGRLRYRCEECEEPLVAGQLVAIVGGRSTRHRHRMHKWCWNNGAPWRRAAAERAKAGEA